MKVILKNCYMFIFHMILFFKFTIRYSSRNFFVKRSANIKGIHHLKIGKNVQIGKDIRINFFIKDKKLILKDNVYICNRVSFIVGDQIIIGKDVVIASDVCIVSENHGFDPLCEIPYKDQKLSISPISIGDNCWIGEKSIILPGVNIGQGSVIGAGSIVTKSVPDYSVVVGNPARIIKQYDFDRKEWIKKS